MEKVKISLPTKKVNKFAFISLFTVTLLGGMAFSSHSASANTVNDYIKQGMTQKGWTPAKEENRLGGIKYKNNYNNGKGRPTMIINHDTANPNSTIDGEIGYMTRNQEAAFVHEFVDGTRMIGIADTDYLAWGAGPQGNGRGVQVEQVHVHSKDDFAKELINLAQFNVNIMKQYRLAPSLGQPNGSGSIWTHAMVSRWLGGSDHVDPDGYWADSARQWFGTTYNINDFATLVNDMYYDKVKPDVPASVQTSTKVYQDGGNFIANVTVSGDTDRITEIQVPTWSDPNQKDLKWYTASKINANTYQVVIPTSNHKSTGNYTFHTYVRTNDGKFTSKNANSLNYIVNQVKGTTEHVMVNGNLLIRTTLSGDVGRVTSVQVPTWSDPAQKDIVWYPMVKKSNNVYEYVVDNMSARTYGTINTHVYTVSDGWQLKNVTTNGFSYQPPMIQGKTTVNVTGSTVELTSHITGDVDRIDFVQFPTWHDKQQRDLKWYRATKVNNNDYKLTIPLSDFNNAKGDYITHSYIKTKDGKDQAYAWNSYKNEDAKPADKNKGVTVTKSDATDKLGTIVKSSGDVNMYQGNPPLTANGGKVVDKVTSRDGQTFRVLRESVLSNGQTFSYGLFGDKQYYWISNDNLKNVVATPEIKSDESLLAKKTYSSVNKDATDIRKENPIYNMAGSYKNYTDVINSNSSKSGNVQVTRKIEYKNGDVWYEFTQSNKNGQPMGWINAKYLASIK